MPPWRLKRWSIALLGLLVLAGVGTGAGDDPVVERMKRDITFLASDACEGRGPGTEGIDKAANYIATEFQLAGLKPGGPKGSYFQPFTVSGVAKLGQPNTLRLRGPLGQEIELKAGVDFQVLGLSGSGTVSAPLVFAGFGATAKEISYDDYKGLDVAGKVVVILRHTPRWSNKEVPFDGPRRDEHAALVKKQALAEANKAAAVLLVNDQTELANGDNLLPFGYIPGMGGPKSIPSLHVRRSVLDAVFQSSLGTTVREVEQAIDRDLTPRSSALPGWTASVQTTVERPTIPVKNIIGVVEGSGPLAKQTVVVGAHYDHLGYGGRSSLAKDKTKKAIHHGADDNGSGTTTVMELARRFARKTDRVGIAASRRRIVFMTFSAEEMGLLGSRHYCNKEPLFPLADTVAMVNLDMVGRLVADPKTQKEKLIVEGLGTGKDFNKVIDRLNQGFLNPGFGLVKKQGGTGPSDHDSFYRQKIPVFFFWTGMHKDYHKPSDTSDKINVAGMARIADLAEKLIADLAARPDRPEYVKIGTDFKSGPGKMPRLGIMPNYEEEKEGVLVAGVSDGGPAAKGGLKVGDQIVEIAGKPIRSINTYMAVMGEQQRGRAIEVGVIRNGKKMTLKVVPQ
jgi:hypothetical protein